MKLLKVDIVNFRSIKQESVTFDFPCRILVGINESGKSNILKALSLLSPKVNPTKGDKREPLPTEAPIDAAFVDFHFALDLIECRKLSTSIFSSEILGEPTKLLFKIGEQYFSIIEFCEYANKLIYRVDIATNVRTIQVDMPNEKIKVLGNWYTHKNYRKVKGQNEKNETNCFFVDNSKIALSLLEGYIKTESEPALEIIVEECRKLFLSEIPETIFWEYKKENDLPALISIDSFKNNPDICVPLKNMFLLSGIEEISKNISESLQGTSNQFRNLLERVAKHASNYIREVWTDYSGVQIALDPDGSNINIAIKEENRFSFDQRSDGFKRFISFILLISTVVRKQKLTDFLLLIDEPEINLHPSGIRHLRNELLKIAENSNYVVVSTHSIFMIDSEQIKRHFIVKKVTEKTEIFLPDEGNLSEEEVIFNAYGFSLYEMLNRKNIIFEGWRDKQLFRIAMTDIPKSLNGLREKFEEIGICHAKGVVQIKNLTPLLELGKRECLILSDSDEPAKRIQTEYFKERGYGTWKRYDEIDSNLNAITGEDFIKPEAIIKTFNLIKQSLNKIASVEPPDIKHKKGYVFAIDSFLKRSGYADDERKVIMNQFKEMLFSDLKAVDIEPFYYEYLEGVSKHI